VTLCELAQRPFTYIWNVENIGMQHYKGITFQVNGISGNHEKTTILRQGIFVTAPFQGNAPITVFSGTSTRVFSSSGIIDNRKTGVDISVLWNTGTLDFTVKVSSNAAFAAYSDEVKTMMGVDLCFDPSFSNRPFPFDKAVVLSVPLQGSPFLTNYKPVVGTNGSFDITPVQTQTNCLTKIRIEKTKGFIATVSIPGDFFGERFPDSLKCNVVVKLPEGEKETTSLGWTNITGTNQYSPALWNTLIFIQKPASIPLFALWIIAFVAGLVLTIVGGIVLGFGKIKKTKHTTETIEQFEEKEAHFLQIRQFIEQNITQKDMALPWVSDKINLPQKSIEQAVKKSRGQTFKDYVVCLRIEIAKERLRSSHSPIKAIAESCGFKSTLEFEKLFEKFCRIDPDEFRKEHQVA
jgi:AraC-like DNA-binding protein